jgi:eukaryotic-like serine/threonine-protein kinase
VMAEKIPEKIGKYEIVELLGRGAMGTVYKARQPGIGRLVALKTINPAILEEADLLKRFYREAQAAGNLQHPNIVTVFELGDSEGVPFIAMELLEGESLDKIIARREPIPLAKKLSIIAQLCRGLDYAHKHGVIHRDIKPANIVLTRDGNTKVVDFGIVHFASTTVTRTGMVIGTVPYMSPQQLNGEHVDARSDIFSVGVVIYEFISCRKAFDGPNLTAVMLQIVSKDPTPLSQVAPGVPPGLEDLVNRCLRKNPEERYQTLEEVGFDLDPIARTVQRDLVLEMVKQGQELVEKKEFTRAREVLRNALSLDSSHDLAKDLMAKVNSELRRLETSVKVQQYLDEAEQLLNQGKYTEAVSSLEEVLRLDSQHGRARAMVESARKEAARVAEVHKSFRAGQQAFKEGDLTQAETLLATVLELDSRNAEASALLTKVHEARAIRDRRAQVREALWYARQMVTQGRYAEAIDQVGKFENEFPNEPDLSQVLASAREGLEKRRRAQQEVVAIQGLIDGRKYKEAVDRAGLARLEFPQEAERLGNLYESAKTQYEAAERRRRIEREVASVQELINTHQHDLAIQRAERLLHDFRDHPDVNRVLALARHQEQLAELRKVATLCQSIQILRDQGRFADAIREAESALREFPRNPDLEIQLAGARKGLEEQVQEKEERRKKEERRVEQQSGTAVAGPEAEADVGATAVFERVEEGASPEIPVAGPRLGIGGEEKPPLAESLSSSTPSMRATSVGRLGPDLTSIGSFAESAAKLPTGIEPPVVLLGEGAAADADAAQAKQEHGLSPGAWRWAVGLLAVMMLAGGAWGLWRYHAKQLASETRPATSGSTRAPAEPRPPSASTPIPAPPATPESSRSVPYQNAGGTPPATNPSTEGEAPSPGPAKSAGKTPNPGTETPTTRVTSARQTQAPPTKVPNPETPASSTTVAASQPPPASADTGELVVTAPAGYQVYVDGNVVGTTDATGSLELKALAPGRHKIRFRSGSTQSDEFPLDVAANEIKAYNYPGMPASPPEPASAKLDGAAAPVAGAAPAKSNRPATPVAVVYPAVRNPVSAARFLGTYSVAIKSQSAGTITIGPETFRFDGGNDIGSVVLPVGEIREVKSSRYKHQVVSAPNMTHSLEIRTVDGKKFHFAVQNLPDKPEAATLLLQTIQLAKGGR